MKSNIGSLPWRNDKDKQEMQLFSSTVSFLQRQRRVGICFVLAFAFGFETAFAFGLLNTTFGVVFSACLLIVLCLYGVNILRRVPVSKAKTNELNTVSLLNRDVIPLEVAEAYSVLKGQVVLVTGAAGSIGSELCRQLLNYEPERLIALDNNETGLFDLAQSLRFHKQSTCFHTYIGDITDVRSMERFFATERPQVVFHAAAYKHVPLLEQHPEQAIRTNTVATYHLCRIAQEHKVARFVFVSTDKAAEPTSMLGASKRLGEMIMQSMAQVAACDTRFCAVRFGNVIGSRGSVVPVFAQQISQGGPVTVTDPAATRYFMTIPEACGLVILTAAIADQGGLYLLDMGEPVRIVDVAIKMIRSQGLRVGRDISIVYTGLRPGEKLHETLVAATEELQATVHTKIFSVAPGNTIASLACMTQRIHVLEQSLQYEQSSQLRERLFEFVREQELMIAK